MYFRRSDRRAILFLFAVVLAFWAGVLLERQLSRHPNALLTLDEAVMDSLSPQSSLLSSSGEGYSSTANHQSSTFNTPETFPFDPNTADSAAFRRLGLTEWQIQNIYKYRAHGGRYHRPEDFKRLYGMTPEVYERLEPFIRIDRRYRYYDEEDFAADDARRAHSDSLRAQRAAADAARRDSLARLYPRQEKFTELVQLDLNTVDTTMLKKVPGIASVRARQILRYRDRLGGFVSADQLAEISDFPLELQPWFSVKSGVYRKLNINTATVADLSRHPYIGAARARAIVGYRQRRGSIHSLSELSLLPEFDEETIRRIEPYIEY